MTDLPQLQQKQKNEAAVQKAAEETLASMSPPLQPERQQGLAAGPGCADIRQRCCCSRRTGAQLCQPAEVETIAEGDGEDECARQSELIGRVAADGRP